MRRRPGDTAPTAPGARRTTRVEAPAAIPASRGTSTFTSRALILLLVVAVLGVSYASSIRAWLNQRDETHALSAQVVRQQQAIAELRTAKARWNDPAYVEAQARLRFGWVMPGERSYRVIGKDGKVLTAGQSELPTGLPAATAEQGPWWAGTVQSLVQAGNAPAVPPKATPVRHPATRIGPTSGSSTNR